MNLHLKIYFFTLDYVYVELVPEHLLVKLSRRDNPILWLFKFKFVLGLLQMEAIKRGGGAIRNLPSNLIIAKEREAAASRSLPSGMKAFSFLILAILLA